MNRTRLILLGASVAFLALLAFGVIRLSRSYAAATEAREARDTAFANLQNLYTANPFPSVENAERMRRDVAALERMRAALTNAVSAGVTKAAIPAAVALMGWAFLGERVAPRTGVAVVCAVAGIALFSLSKQEQTVQDSERSRDEIGAVRLYRP